MQYVPGIAHTLPCLSHNSICLADAACFNRWRIAFDTDGFCLSFNGLLQFAVVEADDHAGKVVGGEAGKSVVDE